MQTVPAVIGLLATVGVGLYLARSFIARQLLVLLALGMQPGLVASAWALVREWPGTIDEGGRSVGIYYIRNSLGPPAVIGLAAVVVLLCRVLWQRVGFWPLKAVGLLWLAILDLRLQQARAGLRRPG